MPTIAVHSKAPTIKPIQQARLPQASPFIPQPLISDHHHHHQWLVLPGGRAALRADPRWRLKQRGNQLRRSLAKNKRALASAKGVFQHPHGKRCGYAPPLRWQTPPPTAERAKEETARAGKRLQERNLTGAFCCQPAKLKSRYTYLPYLHTFWPLIR